MPIYEYECTKCGHHEELLQKFSDSPLEACPVCKGRMKKLMSMNTFHLKGSGWYVTDYAGKTGGGESKSGSAGGASKGEAKPKEQGSNQAGSAQGGDGKAGSEG